MLVPDSDLEGLAQAMQSEDDIELGFPYCPAAQSVHAGIPV